MTILNSLYFGIALILLGLFILYRSVIVSEKYRDKDITETKKSIIIQNYLIGIIIIILGIIFLLKNV